MEIDHESTPYNAYRLYCSTTTCFFAPFLGYRDKWIIPYVVAIGLFCHSPFNDTAFGPAQ
jgi:hypothetical protein